MPSCGYQVDYQIRWEDLVLGDGVRYSTAPVEVLYDASTYTFTIEKCSARQQPFEQHYDPECLDLPVYKHYRVWIETTLVGEPFGATDTSLYFDVEIGSYCAGDTIFFDPASLIGDFTYDLRVPAALYSNGLTVVQQFEACPVQCSLTLADGSPIPPEFGVSDPGIFPILEILTDNKNLNNLPVTYQFTCASILSEQGPASVTTHQVTVTYRDECYDTTVFAPITEDATVYLYEESQIQFTVPTTTLACGAPETTIIYLDPSGPDTPPVSVNDPEGTIIIDPSSPASEGEYIVVLQSCITV